eukprot:CAMPEP_0119299268 /NCGR_PEP_ID=MMETSP1333-20130426/1366_1 /TAXON_ID=418940 /ORGANISM="Scyphosphaera apsteinii, Strain RCC1455" /LENGTH=270 /DNA_ID=CAMNT_0007300643 /DNA_START=65 /DNA_END=877 /DNA_ORIENTATION=+
MALDDVIKSNSRRPVSALGRAPGGRAPGGRTPARRQSDADGRVVSGRAPGGPSRSARQETRAKAAPYSGLFATRHGSNLDDEEEGMTTLKVSSTTKPNAVAGAICSVARKSNGDTMPSIAATGPAAINQAIKGLAIARKYLLEDDTPIDFFIQPQFEQDVRQGSNVIFELTATDAIEREPSEDDLSAKEKTDCFKLAGAVAGRVRNGEEVSITTKGQVPVLVAVKAISLAQSYVREEDLDIKFAIQFRDLEDPELRGSPASTFLHFAIVY